MSLRRTTLPLTLLALLLACNSSTSPKATVAGTWHVTLGTLTNGTLTPSSFDIVVPSSGSIITMPTLTWSVGPEHYDSLPSLASFADTTMWGFGEGASSPTRPCEFMGVSGTLNAAKDTLLAATVALYDTVTISSVLYCQASVTGSATVHK